MRLQKRLITKHPKFWAVGMLVLTAGILMTVLGGGKAKAAARCDQGFNTAWYNQHATLTSNLPPKTIAPVGFSLEQWADTFTNPALGLSKATVLAQLNANPAYKHQILGGVLTSKLGLDWWDPSTADCIGLRNQLQAARNVAKLLPTGAVAAQTGYTRTSNYLGGVGTVYQNTELANQPFSPYKPAQILYDGAQADAKIVGLSYLVYSPNSSPPSGFVGNNDRWVRHKNWCLNSNNILIAADLAAVNPNDNFFDSAQCTAAGGHVVANPGWWTLHVWVVPGCENDWGVFSNANPRMPYMRAGMSRSVGCGSGRALNSPLNFDASGLYTIN